ncbi:hypothetical protein, partial [Pseudomonas sp. MWU13-2100]|uniref:hypothetical protein n=1 Tax=Pseudomonas sp. MWU13-2100 TaxID=2935075 RepID=UPI00200FDBF4
RGLFAVWPKALGCIPFHLKGSGTRPSQPTAFWLQRNDQPPLPKVQMRQAVLGRIGVVTGAGVVTDIDPAQALNVLAVCPPFVNRLQPRIDKGSMTD